MHDERTPTRQNGHGRSDPSSALARSDGQRAPAALGDVVRDAMDHARVIVRDTVAIGKLEAKQAAEHITKDVAPRAAFGIGAAVLGAIGGTLFLISLFIGLGVLIPSVGWRLFLFAVGFLGLAGIGGYLASRPRRETASVEVGRAPRTTTTLITTPADLPKDPLRHVAPIHPVDGIGE